MSKEKEKTAEKEVEETKVVSPKNARQERWEKHLETYKARNPVKFATKEKRGEFDSIPESFR